MAVRPTPNAGNPENTNSPSPEEQAELERQLKEETEGAQTDTPQISTDRPTGQGPDAKGKPGAGGSADGGTNQGVNMSPTQLHDLRSGFANADGEVIGAVVSEATPRETPKYDMQDPGATIDCPNVACKLVLFPYGMQGKTLVCACGQEVSL